MNLITIFRLWTIRAIFNIHKKDLFQLSKDSMLTMFHEAARFTLISKCGSRHFDHIMGNILHNYICLLSKRFNRLNIHSSSGCDGENDICLFEIKSQFNTMKGSEAMSEISKKLKYCIERNLEFKLLIFTDKKNISRDIPLHKGNALNKIKDTEGYNKDKHRWISGNNVWKYLFEEWLLIKYCVANNIRRITPL